MTDAALQVLEDQVMRECGLRLNRGKTEWHAASAATGERVRAAMEEADLKEGRDGAGNYGIVVVGIPVGCAGYVGHFVRRRTEEALSKATRQRRGAYGGRR